MRRNALKNTLAVTMTLGLALPLAAQWTPQPPPADPSTGISTVYNVGVGTSAHPWTRLRLTNPAVSTESPGSGGQLAFGTPTAQWWIFRTDAANNLFLDRQGNGWSNLLKFDLSTGATTLDSIAGIGVAAFPTTRLRLTNPPVATDSPGSGGQLAFGTTTAQYWMFRMDSSNNLSLDRCCWAVGMHFNSSTGNVGIGAPGTVPLDVFNGGNAFIRARGGYAGLLLNSGDGTTSTRYSFIDLNSSETQPAAWRVGMNGTQDFTISDYLPPAYPTRLTLTRSGEFIINGNISATGAINAKYQDMAEWVSASEAMPDGTVVVVDGDSDDGVEPSSGAYDTRVAGVVSAHPGIVLGTESADKAKIATTGRVKVRVDATRAPIRRGDLLVTSDKPGVAMKSEPISAGGVLIHRPGTVIGKALEPLASGQGEILVLLSLQ